MKPTTETELKLTLGPDALDALSSGRFIGQDVKTFTATTLHSVYYDTHDHKLRKAGLILRVRQDGDKAVQTVKSNSRSLERGEWEAELPGAEPDSKAAAGSPLAPLLRKGKIRNDLRPIFTVDVERHTCTVERDGAKIELALDRGAIRAGGEERQLCEVELELKEGDQRALFDLASEIGGKVQAFVSFRSKGDRGYALLRGEGQAPLKTPEFHVVPEMSTGAAVRAIGHTCAATMFENLALFLATSDIEGLHQSRVSVRRTRAIWSLFKPILAASEPEGPVAELKSISDLLGEARDLDVFLGEALGPMAQEHSAAPGFSALISVFEARRNDAYQRLTDSLRSQRFYALSLAVVRRLDGDPWAFDPDDVAVARRDQPIECFVSDGLGRRLRSLLKKSDDLQSLSPVDRHRVRIKAKTLRYMMEPFADLAEGNGHKPVLKELKVLQDALGKLNDARVSAELMTSIGNLGLGWKGADPKLLFAAGLVAGVQREDPKLLGEAQKARDRLARIRPFWDR